MRNMRTLAVVGGLTVGLASHTGAAMAAPADGGAPTAALEVVVDGSGSMAAPNPSGGTKLEAAKAALSSLVDGLPAGSRVGVRAYGGRYGDSDPRSCKDIRLVVPLGPLSAAAAKASVATLQPLGQTPIAASLQAAAKDLGGTGARTIVLISDGEETCAGAPCDMAKSLKTRGFDLTVDTVGYGANAATTAQLQCIAAATGGVYLPAADGPALRRQLQHLSARALKAYEPEGEPVTGALGLATPPTLVPGQYLDTLAAGETKNYALDMADGVTPYVAATLVRAAGPVAGAGGTGEFDAVVLRLLNPEGNDCNIFGRDAELQNSGGTPSTAVLFVPTMDREWFTGCGRPGHYVLTAQREATPSKPHNEVLPLELRVVMEPPVTGGDALPLPSLGEPLPAPEVLGTATPVSGGGSPNTAAALTSGLWSDDIQPGETLYYRVPVEWGQRLSAAVAVPHLTEFESARLTTAVNLTLVSPVRAPLTTLEHRGDFGVFASRFTQTLRLHAATPPVVFRNRDENDKDQMTASLAGEWGVAVRMAYGPEALRVPFRLAVQVVGAAAGAPRYAVAPTAPPLGGSDTPASVDPQPTRDTTAAAPAAPASTGEPSAPVTGATPSAAATSPPFVLRAGRADGNTGRTVGLAAAGALAILLAGGLLLPLLRRRS